jgi:hypothetical protein
MVLIKVIANVFDQFASVLKGELVGKIENLSVGGVIGSGF